MPHSRARYGLSALERKLRFARVVAIQGPRQCGKSYLASHFLKASHPGLLIERFDLGETRAFAAQNPDLFLRERAQARPLVIDEAQKVPAIFDAVKVRVDEDPSPGRYILLGSTEFSHRFRIQESLTGRMSRLRLHPLTLGETLSLPHAPGDAHGLLSSAPRAGTDQVLAMLDRGGMPGIFAMRSDDEREGLFEDWISLTCNRDLHQIPRLKLDSDLGREILRVVATTDEPIESEIARTLRVSAKIARKHLAAFETLFVLQRLKPHPAGTGKDRYYLCDAGIARFLGSRRQRLLETWMLHELSAKRALLPAPSKRRLSYYRTSKGSTIPLVVDDESRGVTVALQALYQEKVDQRDLAIVKGFERALRKQSDEAADRLRPFLLLSSAARQEVDGARVLPWGALA